MSTAFAFHIPYKFVKAAAKPAAQQPSADANRQLTNPPSPAHAGMSVSSPDIRPIPTAATPPPPLPPSAAQRPPSSLDGSTSGGIMTAGEASMTGTSVRSNSPAPSQDSLPENMDSSEPVMFRRSESGGASGGGDGLHNLMGGSRKKPEPDPWPTECMGCHVRFPRKKHATVGPSSRRAVVLSQPSGSPPLPVSPMPVRRYVCWCCVGLFCDACVVNLDGPVTDPSVLDLPETTATEAPSSSSTEGINGLVGAEKGSGRLGKVSGACLAHLGAYARLCNRCFARQCARSQSTTHLSDEMNTQPSSSALDTASNVPEASQLTEILTNVPESSTSALQEGTQSNENNGLSAQPSASSSSRVEKGVMVRLSDEQPNNHVTYSASSASSSSCSASSLRPEMIAGSSPAMLVEMVDLLEKLAGLETENKALKASLQSQTEGTSASCSASTNSSTHSHEKRIFELETLVSTQKHDLEQLRGTLDQKEHEIVNLKDQTTKSVADYDRRVLDFEMLESKLHAANRDLIRLCTGLAKKDERIAAQTKEIDELKQELAVTKSSQSGSKCLVCNAAFNLTRRRHTCRFCHRVVCWECGPYRSVEEVNGQLVLSPSSTSSGVTNTSSPSHASNVSHSSYGEDVQEEAESSYSGLYAPIGALRSTLTGVAAGAMAAASGGVGGLVGAGGGTGGVGNGSGVARSVRVCKICADTASARATGIL